MASRERSGTHARAPDGGFAVFALAARALGADGAEMELLQGGLGEVRRSEVIAALSHALDMTEGHPVGQAERTCLIGMRVASELQLSGDERYALYYALLLKDVGCSSSAARMCELFGTDDIALKTDGKLVDWTKPAQVARYTSQHVAAGGRIARAQRTLSVLRSLVAEGKAIVATRCDRGASIVARLGFPAEAAEAVRALDEYWDGRGQPSGLEGDEIPLLARIACLSQTFEVFFATHGLAAAKEMVRERRGRWFDPAVADVVLAIGAGRRALERSRARRHRLARARPRTGRSRTRARRRRARQHLRGVRRRHRRQVAVHGQPLARRRDLRRHDRRGARLLGSGAAAAAPRRAAARHRQARHPEHDPRQAREAQRRGVRAHPPAPRVHRAHPRGHPGLRRHRRYRRGPPRAHGRPRLPPRRARRATCHISARVLAAADVFDALTAERPYRGPMDADAALAIERSDAGKALDPLVVEALAAGIDERHGATRPERRTARPPRRVALSGCRVRPARPGAPPAAAPAAGAGNRRAAPPAVPGRPRAGSRSRPASAGGASRAAPRGGRRAPR